jgi:hypothetical protein
MNTVVWKENLLAILIAWVLSLSVFVVLDNMSFFQANIIASPQDELQAADIVLEAQWSSFELRAKRDFINLSSASVLIFTNPETITLDPATIRSPHQWTITTQTNGSYLLTFDALEVIDANETFVSFIIEWPYEDITIGDIVLGFADSSTQLLSLGTKIIE